MTPLTLVLIGTPEELSTALRHAGALVTTADHLDALDPAVEGAAAVVVAGADVGLRVAQQVGRLDTRLPVLVLERGEGVDQARDRIRTTPFVGRNSRCLDGGRPIDEVVSSILDEASQRVRSEVHAERIRQIHDLQLPEALADEGRTSQYLGQLVEYAPIGVATVDPAGIVRGWNPAAAAITGRQERDAIGTAVAGLFQEADQGALDVLLAEALVSQGSATGTFTRRGPLGDDQVLEVVAASLDQGEGHLGTLVLFQDVTVRVRAEVELRTRAREAMLAASVGAAVTRPNPLPRKLQACAEAVVEHLDAAFARIWSLEPAGNVLRLEASAGLYTHLDGEHSRVAVGAFKIGRIAAHRRPHLSNDVVTDPEVSDPSWARREGMVSFAGYPLIAGDELWGVLALFGRRPLPTATLNALAAVADTVAVAMQQAHSEERIRSLLEAEQQARRAAEDASRRHAALARTLQQSLLPPSLPDVEGLSVAARYHWAGSGEEIGGDFYDMLMLPDGSWCAVLGDISGKGVGAARTTALIRYTLRATARSESDLATLVGNLNEVLYEDPTSDRYCTLVLASGRPDDPTSVTLLLAGHPFPTLLHGDGTVEEVGTPNVPVGMFQQAVFDVASIVLPEGATLVLYTDGVTDARSPDGVFHPDLAAEVLPAMAGCSPGAVAARLEEAAVDYQAGRPLDDIAIMAISPTAVD
jgi:PAS domain S-box-containing protein